MGSDSESGKKVKQLALGVCDMEALGCGCCPARVSLCSPRMYRFEARVAALSLIEAHSHTGSSFPTDQTVTLEPSHAAATAAAGSGA